MEKVCLYARVSSDSQKENETIESQVAELKEICQKNKVKIVKEYIDDGWSGETLARRGLDQLRDDASRGIWETVYIYKADRLGRDHIDQGIVLRDLKKQGIKVVFGNRPLTEENKLLSDVESLLAEHEKRQFMERTRRGKLHKAKSGKHIHCRPPFGYKFIKKGDKEWVLVVNPEEAKIVKLIFDLYFKIQSSHGVARELYRKEVKTRDGCIWRQAKITIMLKNETYIGNWHYGKEMRVEPKRRDSKFYKRVRSSHRTRDKKDWITVKVPAIIDKAIFEKVQELRKKNFKLYGKTKYTYILGGLLKCAKCGARMVGFCHRHKFFYYRCSRRSQHFANEPNYCRAGSIRKDALESAVWNDIKRAIQNPKILLQYASHLNKQDKDGQMLLEEKKDLFRKKEQIKQKKSKLFDLYEEENIDKEELSRRMGDHSQAEKSINSSLREIEARLNQADNKQIVIKKLKEFSELTKPQLDTLNEKQKKEFLKIVIKEITYDSDTRKVNIVGHIPIEEIAQKELKELMFIPVQTLAPSSTRSH